MASLKARIREVNTKILRLASLPNYFVGLPGSSPDSAAAEFAEALCTHSTLQSALLQRRDERVVPWQVQTTAEIR